MLLCQSYVFIGLLSKWQLRQAVLVQCLIFPMWAAWHDTGSGPMWFDSKHAAQPTLPGGVRQGARSTSYKGGSWNHQQHLMSEESCAREPSLHPLCTKGPRCPVSLEPCVFCRRVHVTPPCRAFEKRSSPLNQRCSPSDVRSVRRRL